MLIVWKCVKFQKTLDWFNCRVKNNRKMLIRSCRSLVGVDALLTCHLFLLTHSTRFREAKMWTCVVTWITSNTCLKGTLFPLPFWTYRIEWQNWNYLFIHSNVVSIRETFREEFSEVSSSSGIDWPPVKMAALRECSTEPAVFWYALRVALPWLCLRAKMISY